MKKSTLLLITLFLFLQSCKNQENLYLLFDNNSKSMTKVRIGRDEPYNYNFKFHKNTDLNFTSNLLDNQKPQIDTLTLNILKKIKGKDYKWLNNFILKFEHPDYINFQKFYKELYIVEIDSITNRVIISKVHRVWYED